MNLFERLAYKTRASTKLWQLFQGGGSYQGIARLNFERCLQAKEIEVTQSVYSQARLAASTDPQMSVGEFIERRLIVPR